MKRLFCLFACLVFMAENINAQSSLKLRFDSLTREYQQSNFHGVIMVADKDNILYKNAFGYAELDKKILMTVDKLFKTESVGKMFTSARVMQLMEQGKIDLNRTVAEYLPDWKIKNAGKITIHHLLNHTSGLTSTWDDPKYADIKFIPDPELKALIESQPLAFDEPGSKMYYSNSAYMILGELISRLDKMPFDESIRANIFKPSGMEKIDHLNDTVMPDNGARPYFFLSSKDYQQDNRGVGPKAGPAGGWITSAPELMKFLQAYMSTSLLTPGAKEIQLTANRTEDIQKKGWHFTYGLMAITDEIIAGKTLVGHNGGGAGFTVDAFFEPESGYAVVMCSNMYGTGYQISSNYFNILLNKPLIKVQQSNLIRVVDIIQEKGASYLKDHPDTFFNELGIKPSVLLLINASEHLEKLRNMAASGEVLEVAQRLFPDAPNIWLSSGNFALNSQKRQQAKAFYEKAKKLAEEQKNDFILNMANDRLKEMAN